MLLIALGASGVSKAALSTEARTPPMTRFAADRAAHQSALTETDARKRDRAASNLLKLYFQYGLIDEARGVRAAFPAAALNNDTYIAVLDALADKSAAKLFAKGENGDAEACVWGYALAASPSELSGAEYCATALVDDLPTYPEWFSSRYLSTILSNLLAAKEYDLAFRTIESVKASLTAPAPADISGALHLAQGKLFSVQDKVAEAVAAYERVSSPPSLVAEASLHRIALLWRLGIIEVDTAADELSRLSRSWRGGDIEARALLGLSHALHFASSPYSMMEALAQVVRDFPSTPHAADAQRRINQGLEDIFVRGRFSRTPVADYVEIYEAYRKFKSSHQYWSGDLLFALKAADAGLAEYAARIFDERVVPNLAAAPARARVEAMAFALQLGDDQAVIDIGAAALEAEAPDELLARKREIEATALWRMAIAKNEPTPQETLTDPLNIRRAATIAWGLGNWAAFDRLSEPEDAPPRSGERSGGVFDRRAIARYLLGQDEAGAWPRSDGSDLAAQPASKSDPMHTERSSSVYRRRLGEADRVINLERALKFSDDPETKI